MGLFKRAQVGDVPPIGTRSIEKVLVVLDGSSQDALSIALARHLRDRFESKLLTLDAREALGSGEVDLAPAAAQELDAGALGKQGGESFSQILAAIEESGCDLVLLPCPYGRDLETVGTDSTGTVIDILLARSPVPLLVIRQPFELGKNPFGNVIFVLIGENEAAEAAASWAATLVGLSGRFELVFVLEEEFYENIRELLQALRPEMEITPDSLREALEREHVRLHRGLQKAAAEVGFKYQMFSQSEGGAGAKDLADKSGHPLLVLALEREDHASVGHVHDHIRHSPNPVLVVPNRAS